MKKKKANSDKANVSGCKTRLKKRLKKDDWKNNLSGTKSCVADDWACRVYQPCATWACWRRKQRMLNEPEDE